MSIGLTLAVVVGAYILGAVPFGLMIAKRYFNVDIRELGSKNIGATNVYRVLGKKAGAAVFTLDILKGLAPVLLAHHLFGSQHAWVVLTGVAAILGHTFSPFLGFKGGKGVATSLGVAFGFSWQAGLICFVVWCLIVWITGYVSVASIVGAPLAAVLIWYFNGEDPIYAVFGIVVASFVVLKHRANIARLRRGEELKITGKKKDNQ